MAVIFLIKLLIILRVLSIPNKRSEKMVSYLDDQSFISKCYHVLLFIIPSQGDNQ